MKGQKKNQSGFTKKFFFFNFFFFFFFFFLGEANMVGGLVIEGGVLKGTVQEAVTLLLWLLVLRAMR